MAACCNTPVDPLACSQLVNRLVPAGLMIFRIAICHGADPAATGMMISCPCGWSVLLHPVAVRHLFEIRHLEWTGRGYLGTVKKRFAKSATGSPCRSKRRRPPLAVRSDRCAACTRTGSIRSLPNLGPATPSPELAKSEALAPIRHRLHCRVLSHSPPQSVCECRRTLD